jgi:peroxiredoxin Q/BCP
MPVRSPFSSFGRWFLPENHALPPGSPLPDLSATNERDEQVHLRNFGEGWTFVYFYPQASTPGCTAQACSLRDAYAELLDQGITVFGVSADRPPALRRFRETQALPFQLLSDPDGHLADAFLVPRFLGFAKRQAFLFKDGLLVWRDLHASTTRQATDVLAALREHG